MVKPGEFTRGFTKFLDDDLAIREGEHYEVITWPEVERYILEALAQPIKKLELYNPQETPHGQGSNDPERPT